MKSGIVIFLFLCSSDGKEDVRRMVERAEEYSALEIPPSLDSAALQVNVSLNVRNILDVDEKTERLTLESSVRMLWIDPRVRPNLRENQTFVSLNEKDDIETFWLPDLFVDRVRSLRWPRVQVSPATLRIHESGLMRYSARINYEVACNMDFHRFPLDEQVCEVNFESFGYTTDQLKVSWSTDNCQFNPNISLDQFEASATFQSAYSTDYYDKNYPGVILKIFLKRKMTYHLVQTYLPSLVFVVISWLSLLIDPKAIPGRASMVMMAMLTLMAMFSGVRQNTPKVSYVSFLDAWMALCLLALFVSLLEFSTVAALVARNMQKQADEVDKWGLRLIPALFVILNVGYWTLLLLF